jgi:hypothetical protein
VVFHGIDEPIDGSFQLSGSDVSPCQGTKVGSCDAAREDARELFV